MVQYKSIPTQEVIGKAFLSTKANKNSNKLDATQVKKLNLLQNNRGLSTHRVPSWVFSAAKPIKPNQQTQQYIFTY